VPDRKHHQIDVLTPIYYGSSIPQEPNHVISLGGSPQSVAITSDGNLAFIALADGHIAMYDIFGKQMLNTIFVGGSTHFIITGLYPPAIGTTRQQAAAADIARTIGAYLLVSAIILLPLWFRWENPASVS
jgi:Ca2+/Na+ antiporter